MDPSSQARVTSANSESFLKALKPRHTFSWNSFQFRQSLSMLLIFFCEAWKSENDNFSVGDNFSYYHLFLNPPRTHTFSSQFIMAIFQLFQATFFSPSSQSDRMTFPGCGAKCDCFDYDSLGDHPWSWPNAV